LFISVAESIVIFAPMDHVGCDRACSLVTVCSSVYVRERNGPPEADDHRVHRILPVAISWNKVNAGIDRQDGRLLAGRQTRHEVPAHTRLLLAKAIGRPLERGDGRSPAKPTMGEHQVGIHLHQPPRRLPRPGPAP
jgi:hypothetical protein